MSELAQQRMIPRGILRVELYEDMPLGEFEDYWSGEWRDDGNLIVTVPEPVTTDLLEGEINIDHLHSQIEALDITHSQCGRSLRVKTVADTLNGTDYYYQCRHCGIEMVIRWEFEPAI